MLELAAEAEVVEPVVEAEALAVHLVPNSPVEFVLGYMEQAENCVVCAILPIVPVLHAVHFVIIEWVEDFGNWEENCVPLNHEEHPLLFYWAGARVQPVETVQQ